MVSKQKPMANQSFDSQETRRIALELASLILIGFISLCALVIAFTYDFSSSRPLFVILIPLVALILVQIYRTMKQANAETSLDVVKAALGGKVSDFAVSVKFFYTASGAARMYLHTRSLCRVDVCDVLLDPRAW